MSAIQGGPERGKCLLRQVRGRLPFVGEPEKEAVNTPVMGVYKRFTDVPLPLSQRLEQRAVSWRHFSVSVFWREIVPRVSDHR